MILSAVAFTLGAPPRIGLAQTGPALMLRPWADDQEHVELSAQALLENRGHTNADHGLSLQRYDSSGRGRLDPSADHGPTFGYDFTYISITSDDPALPERLVDESLGYGMGLGRIGDWKIGADVGIGYAGTNPYADSHALYGLADVIVSHDLDETSTLTLTLNYDGNRTLWPDIPLPTVSYSHKVSDAFRYTVGVPFTGLTWKPFERLTVDVDYLVPLNLNATVGCEVVKGWTVFTGFYNKFNAFNIDDAPGNDRLFFQQRQVEAGVRWRPCKGFEVLVAGGYAFGQRFETGWDARQTDTLRKASDEPYVRVAGEIAF